MDYLKVYTAYVQNFNTSMAVIERVQKKKEVAAYFQKCKEHPEGKSLDLASFLIMPVQRIPRYNLLLTDMMRHTWEDHPDYNNLKKVPSSSIAHLFHLFIYVNGLFLFIYIYIVLIFDVFFVGHRQDPVDCRLHQRAKARSRERFEDARDLQQDHWQRQGARPCHHRRHAGPTQRSPTTN